MAHALYVHELEELVEELTASMVHDHDAFLFGLFRISRSKPYI
jgi:hypothetical protein